MKKLRPLNELIASETLTTREKWAVYRAWMIRDLPIWTFFDMLDESCQRTVEGAVRYIVKLRMEAKK